VEDIVTELKPKLKPNALFYDSHFQPQLARPSLDLLLQDIYEKRSKLIVVFLSGDYEKKEWCGVEFRAIKEIIMERKYEKVMFIKVDDGPVKGIFKTDGYIDSRKFAPQEIAGFIFERSLALSNMPKDIYQYNVSILSPNEGEHLFNPVLVKGSFKQEPPDGLFYCFELNPQLGTYWPKTKIHFNKKNGDWSALLSMGEGDDLDRIIYVIAVGNEGLELIKKHKSEGMIIGLDELSADMVIVDECRIILKRKL